MKDIEYTKYKDYTIQIDNERVSIYYINSFLSIENIKNYENYIKNHKRLKLINKIIGE